MCATSTHAQAYSLRTRTHIYTAIHSWGQTMRCVLEGVRNAAASSVWLLAAAHRHNKRAGSLSAGRVSYCVEKKLTVIRPHLNSNTHTTSRSKTVTEITKASCAIGNRLAALHYYSAIYKDTLSRESRVGRGEKRGKRGTRSVWIRRRLLTLPDTSVSNTERSPIALCNWSWCKFMMHGKSKKTIYTEQTDIVNFNSNSTDNNSTIQ